MNFLSRLAEAVLADRSVALNDTVVILPNKRAKRMLLQEICKRIDTPVFAPIVFTINDFIESLSPLKKVNSIELLLVLYEIYKKHENIESCFDSFLSWAPTFINDIDEIDRQMADAQAIFSNLSDIKELETSFGKEALSENQQRYLNFYVSLYDLYHVFNQSLRNDSCGYEGAIYRDVAENIENYAKKYDYKRYLFAGFHILSPSETAVLSFFHCQKGAEFYFDLDNFYFDLVAPFINDIKQHLGFSEIKGIYDDYACENKEIDVVGASKTMTQIYYAIDCIHKIEKDEGTLNNTALVFADESLFLPFIQAYDCSNANITMGYPFSETAAYELLFILLDTAKNGSRFMKMQNCDHFLYYHKDILSFFHHSLVEKLMNSRGVERKKIIDELINKNKILLLYSDFADCSVPFPVLSDNGLEVLGNIQLFFEQMLALCKINTADYYGIELVNTKLKELLLFVSQMDDRLVALSTIEYLVKEKFSGVTVPMRGNPDEGLQIMGLLETRTLDFKNVIMLSVNEGVIPIGKNTPSLILFDVKLHFKLPTYQYKDSVFAYHFFRLLQRAKRIWLLYNTDSSGSLAEKSRFINQLEFEIKNRNLSNIQFQYKTVNILPEQIINKKNIEISKDASMVDNLYNFPFSASSLSDYIKCPLLFYLRHIAKIEPAQNIEDNVEQRSIGNVIHHIMDDLFKKGKDSPAQFSKIIEDCQRKLDDIINDAFKKEPDLVGRDLSRGRLYLATQVVKKSLQIYLKLLENEWKNHPFDIVGTEQKLDTVVPIDKEHQVRLFGIIDRVDLRGDRIVISDYKTGTVNPGGLKLTDMKSVLSDAKYKQLLQLLLYAYLYSKNTKDFFAKTKNIQCCIIGFQLLHFGEGDVNLFPQVNGYEIEDAACFNEAVLKDFEDCFVELIKEITDTAKPFNQTDNKDICKYCDFKSICKK